MNDYKLKFSFSYIDCNNFKEKELNVFRNIISNSRLGRDLKFNSYVNITFEHEDKKHDFPVISVLESFTRGKTNGVIFDVPIGDYNDGTFEKMLLYQTTNKNTGSYGLLFFNTETNLNSHIFNIEYDINELLQHMQRVITSIPFRKTFNAYMENSRKLKSKNIVQLCNE